MKKPNALASALRNSGATVAIASRAPESELPPTMTPTTRHGTKPITVHFPEEVRRQLKSLAADEGRTMEDMVAEAFNLLFAHYRRAELAPRKVAK